MIIKNSQQDIIFNVPQEYINIGMKVSGGADSAILLYLLCKYIKEERPDAMITPITIEKDIMKFHFRFSKLVIDFCKKEFPTVKFAEQIIYQHHESEANYDTTQTIVLNTLVYNKLIDCHFVGITLNPPNDVQFYDTRGDIHNSPLGREDNNELRATVKKSLVNNYTSYRPLVNINKKGIYELYREFNLIDTLFPLTRSCESKDPNKTKNYTIHCKRCWDCKERKWAFGNINNIYDQQDDYENI